MRELPACLADYLPQPAWHAIEEWPKIQSATQRLGCSQVFRARGPAAAHEEVEGQWRGEDVIVVELGCCHYPPSPSCSPEGWQIQAAQEKEARLWLPQPCEQRRESGLAPSRRPFQQEAIPFPDLQTAPLQDGSTARVVMKDQCMCL